METIESFGGEYAFLSNFYPSLLTVQRIEYATVEHAFQAAKTTAREEQLAIAAATTPGRAKRMGQKVSLRPDWELVRVAVMTDLVRRKFTEHDHLTALLLATGDAEIQEGNTWGDRFWGVCRGEGSNHLGRILMEVRAELASLSSAGSQTATTAP